MIILVEYIIINVVNFNVNVEIDSDGGGVRDLFVLTRHLGSNSMSGRVDTFNPTEFE